MGAETGVCTKCGSDQSPVVRTTEKVVQCEHGFCIKPNRRQVTGKEQSMNRTFSFHKQTQKGGILRKKCV